MSALRRIFSGIPFRVLYCLLPLPETPFFSSFSVPARRFEFPFRSHYGRIIDKERTRWAMAEKRGAGKGSEPYHIGCCSLQLVIRVGN